MPTYNHGHINEPGFKRALRLSIDRSNLKLSWVAEQIGVNLTTLSSWCDERAIGQMIPTARLLILLPLLTDFTCLDYLETTVGRVAERVPSPARPFASEATVLREFADFIQEFAKAKEDGRMSEAECARVVEEGQQAMAAIAGVMQYARQTCRQQPSPRAVGR